MLAGQDSGLVAVLLRDRRFGVHVFSSEGAARPPFPAEHDGQRPGARIAVRADGSVLMVPQSGKYVEEFNKDGGLVRRREIPPSSNPPIMR